MATVTIHRRVAIGVPKAGTDFCAYRDETAVQIKAAYGLGSDAAKKRIDEAAFVNARQPFEWSRDGDVCRGATVPRHRVGALLIHGLSDSPFLLHDIGRKLQAEGVLVRGIVLPGHGTVPGDLVDVDQADWVAATAFGIETFRDQVDALYLVGFSTGGGLSVNYMLANPDDPLIKGMVLLAPAVAIQNTLVARIGGLHKLYSWALPTGNWVPGGIQDDVDEAKYESFSKNGGFQVFRLTQAIADKRGRLPDDRRLRMLIAVSDNDETIDPKAAKDFFDAMAAPGSALVNYRRLTRHVVRRTANGDNATNGDVPVDDGEKYAALSHVSVTNRPGNPHYGRNGDYRNCLHYMGSAKNKDALQRCRDGDATNGTIKMAKEMQDTAIQRSTYNPDFADLAQRIADFVGDDG